MRFKMVEAETLFELLHMEIVTQMYSSNLKNAKVEAYTKLEKMGYRVGQSLIERFTRDTPRFKDELEMLRFICKDFWMKIYKKQVDSLKTNHQGVYVLQDENFKLLSKISKERDFTEEARKLLAFPCGIICGSLAGLGLSATVTVDVSSMPACKFTVQIRK
ncbi:trafficking protein particle complex subunit 6B-like [Rhopilema esculentum]|uniref:trafficking protein particle complex subunit 6B-like n=1 Tax=Rhopilema esculentum TaxID=499914 RepID=UPI0031D4B7D2